MGTKAIFAHSNCSYHFYNESAWFVPMMASRSRRSFWHDGQLFLILRNGNGVSIRIPLAIGSQTTESISNAVIDSASRVIPSLLQCFLSILRRDWNIILPLISRRRSRMSRDNRLPTLAPYLVSTPATQSGCLSITTVRHGQAFRSGFRITPKCGPKLVNTCETKMSPYKPIAAFRLRAYHFEILRFRVISGPTTQLNKFINLREFY